MCVIYVFMPTDTKEDFWPPGIGVIGSYEPQYWCWIPNTTESSLRVVCIFYYLSQSLEHNYDNI